MKLAAGTLSLFSAVGSSAVRPSPRILAFAGSTPTGTVSPVASRSLYEVLRVKETASAAEIRGAYRSLAKRFHPDASADVSLRGTRSGEEFIEIRMAYETLSDAAARAQYDLSSRRFRFSANSWPKSRRWETDQCW